MRFLRRRAPGGAVDPPCKGRAPYTPFGGGARKCLGETFALTQTTLALATIASAWQLSPVSGNKPRRGIGTTLTPKKLRLRLHRRDLDN
jgi:cytochrome P450